MKIQEPMVVQVLAVLVHYMQRSGKYNLTQQSQNPTALVLSRLWHLRTLTAIIAWRLHQWLARKGQEWLKRPGVIECILILI